MNKLIGSILIITSSFGCRPLSAPLDLVLQLQIVDVNDNPIPHARVVLASSSEIYNYVVSLNENRDPNELWSWNEVADEKGIADIHPNLEFNNFEKKTQCSFMYWLILNILQHSQIHYQM